MQGILKNCVAFILHFLCYYVGQKCFAVYSSCSPTVGDRSPDVRTTRHLQLLINRRVKLNLRPQRIVWWHTCYLFIWFSLLDSSKAGLCTLSLWQIKMTILHYIIFLWKQNLNFKITWTGYSNTAQYSKLGFNFNLLENRLFTFSLHNFLCIQILIIIACMSLTFV